MRTLLIVLIFTCSSTTFSQNNLLHNQAIEILKQQSPDEYQILYWYQTTPAIIEFPGKNNMTWKTQKTGKIDQYLKCNHMSECLESMSTNVHELNHGISHYRAYKKLAESKSIKKNHCYNFYIKPNMEFLFNEDIELFPSSSLAPYIDENSRTFRYSTYIEGNSSTQSNGILGLLDEYNCYFHSAKTHWELREAFIKYGRNPANGYYRWLNTIYSYMTSHWEFQYFIYQYLKLLRSTDYQTYNQLINITNFVNIFSNVHHEFNELYETYERELGSLDKIANKYGVSLDCNGEWCFLDNQGIHVTDAERDMITVLAISPEFRDIRKDLGVKY